MAELEEFKRKRTAVKAKATRFKHFFENYTPNQETKFEVESRLSNFNELLSEFDKVQDKIDVLVGEPESRERDQFENAFSATVNIAKGKLVKCKVQVQEAPVRQETVASNVGSQLYHARLPIITLPNFDGTYERWQSFHDTFVAMVDSNTSLDDITKFHYLQSALTGKAKEYINSFEVTEANYSLVLELLKKRYHNSRLVINHHVQQLFNLPQVTRESVISLRALSDGLEKHTRILTQLKEPVDKWDTLLIFLASSRLDGATKREWELRVVSDKLSKLSEFIDFLNVRCEMLEAIAPNGLSSISSIKPAINYGKRETKSLVHLATDNPSAECVICRKDHRIYTCMTFRNLSIDEKRNKIRELNLCYNCLGTRHSARECKSLRSCQFCEGKHHSLLHRGNRVESNSNNILHNEELSDKQNNVNRESTGSTSRSIVMMAHKNISEHILSTAIVYIKNNSGQNVKARALLDNGSMLNFITKDLCSKLKLKENEINHVISGIDLTQTKINSYVNTTITSTQNEYKVNSEFFVTNNISHCIPTTKINKGEIIVPEHIILADPEYFDPKPVDLLLGTTVFWDSMESQQIKQGRGHPVLQLTQFGWILGGHLSAANIENHSKSRASFCGFLSDTALQDQVERFWQINEGSANKPRSPEEIKCEEMFEASYSRTTDGRYEVDMMLKGTVNKLGESRTNAERRLLAMERRFLKDDSMRERYHKFLEEYRSLGHMSLVSEDQMYKVKNYLPHHGVAKESSTTTKLRVVFDASCKTKSGISLNDCVVAGPTIQRELFDIIVRFRQHRFVLTGDIIKMYRQIWLKPNQRGLQCILWRNDQTQALETFQLNTVTFGIASSPYLATRCLRQLSIDVEESHPLASRIIRDDFYVDDLLTGGQTVNEIIKIKEEVTSILRSAGFELQKMYSNVDGINDLEGDHEITEIKTLGFRWQPGEDRLRYHTSYEVGSTTITKRIILSAISQIFDPLGLIGPFTVRSKLLLQHMWKIKLEWDKPIPNDLKNKWILHCQQLKEINKIDIPRHVVAQSPQTIQIHGFSDASEVAYGACLYVRSINQDGSILVRLICARSRVAPLKSTSLPRLELCGALLLATLYSKVVEALVLKIDECFFWSDSTITLAWIRGDSSRWQTFVANRVAEIQRLTPENKWNHVSTDCNPADLISRGVDARDLSESTLWWNGPCWLWKDEEEWPQSNIRISEVPEQKKQSLTFALLKTGDYSILRKFSSWNKLCRVVAFCFRFTKNLQRKRDNELLISGCLSVEEIARAKTAVLKLHQQEEFQCEIHNLQQNQPLNHKSKLLAFNPFLDGEGLMRVGGRLTHAPLSYSQRFPIILSKNHVLTELVIRDCHYRNLHAGEKLLAATLRETYWILSTSGAIRRVLRKCILCFRLRPVASFQLMGNLPEARITPSRAFAHVGLDYAGPFNVKISRNKTGKAYLCVFVCMTVKAVHLELVSDLTTNAFLNALKRFISRRGKCLTLMSDNGKNFIGANNELRQIVGSLLSEDESRSKIADFLTNNSIRWSFIPPYSPHMGGLWEAAVKSAKSHLKTVISDTPLTFEELYTVVVQIESILNSRPLYPLSSDIKDLNALTPGHFLIGTALNSILEEDVRDVPLNRPNRFQLLSKMQQSFWQRWSTEYVTQLQSRLKWKQENCRDFIQVGKMVVIKDDNLPPLRWQLGRITELHFGADGLARVVSVRTKSGIVKRALPKICILPLEDDINHS